MLAFFRCLQDAEVLLKLTEEVNATLKNKVSFSEFNMQFALRVVAVVRTLEEPHLIMSKLDKCTFFFKC